MSYKFTWIDFYMEFATKLLNYKNSRSELISKLQKIYSSKGLKFPKLEKTNVPIDIDPFTVFGLFNKGITTENRISILEGIKTEFDIMAEVPSSFDSIPVLNNMKSTYYAFEGERKEHDIDNLWKVLEAALAFADQDSSDTRTAFLNAYDSVLGQSCIRWNITMGLYWVRPYCFINLDSRNRWFMSDEKNISEKVAKKVAALKKEPSASEYLNIRDGSLDAAKTGRYSYSNFPELSYSAWKASIVAKKEFEEDDSPLLLEFVKRIISEYPSEKQKTFAENDFGKFIRTSVPKNIFKTGIVNQTDYSITGSVGQGSWVTIPWVAIFDKKVTKSAQKGEYIIYLLSQDQKTLYLTFNQGCTDLIGQYGNNKTLEILQQNVANARQHINARGFSTSSIDLATPGELKAQMYEAGCIFSKAYVIDNLPTEEEIREDLKNMVDVYQEYISMFGVNGETSSSEKKAWLITYNVKNWDWVGFKGHCEDTLSGKKHEEEWACASKKPKLGDDVYLMKTGDKPRGIMAHGVISQEAFEAPHYNPEKAAQGQIINKIKVKFDRIINYYSEEILSQEDLKAAMPDQEWSPMASGVEIKDYYKDQLRKMWNKHIGIDELEDEGGEQVMRNREFGLNTILYGPPGTGKTYITVKYAVSICDPEFAAAHNDYDDLFKRYKELKSEGRIAFTTFHQSYGYEEFIEGIKPVIVEGENDEENSEIRYTIEDGIFKKFCEKASTNELKKGKNYGFNDDPTVWKVSLLKSYDNPVRKECLENGLIRIGWPEYGSDITEETKYEKGGKVSLNAFINRMREGDIVLSCYSQTQIDAIGVVISEYYWDDSYDEYKRVRKVDWILKKKIDIRKYNGGRNLVQTTVYKMALNMNDIIQMLRDEMPSENKTGNPVPQDNYVFIIDEINRGNISKIFGELITIIEETKRIGNEEETYVQLPYSYPKYKKEFGVPKNVYILGTMNTADRSIALMDTALRRRFDFIEMMPNSEVIKDIKITDGETLDVSKMLETINKRIEYLYDREHTIGHAFFTKLKGENATLSGLAKVFKNKVIPLLQEYFYEDYEKIQLVLGDDDKSDKKYKFIADEDAEISDIFKSSPDLDVKEKMYKINDEAFKYIQSYIEITEKRKAVKSSEETD